MAIATNSNPKRCGLCLAVLSCLLAATFFPAAGTRAGLDGSTTEGFLATLTGQERAWLRDHPVISVAQDPGWPPVEFSNERGEPTGMSRDYLDLIERRLGITFALIPNLSWGEAYERLKRWEIDMTPSVAETPPRMEFWAFTKPYLTIPIVIATQLNVNYIADIRELAGKKVAVVGDYAIDDWLTRDFPEIELVRVATALAGLQKLQRGEVFAYIDNLLIIGNYQAKMEVTNIKIAGQTPYVNAQCMAVRKDWPLFAGILQKALDSISATERNDIYRKWLPVRYEQGFNHVLLWKVLACFAAVILSLLLWNRKLAGEINFRKQAEKALRESEERHRRYLMNSPYGIFVADERGRYLEVNPSACRITGYEKAELLTMSIPDILPEESRDAGLRHFQTVVREGKAQGEILFRHKSGDRRWWAVTAVKISAGRFLAFCNDVTERKLAEEKILETNSLLNSVLDGTTDAIFVKDREGRYLLVNAGVCRAVSRPAEDIIGRTDREIFPPESAGIIREADRQVLATGAMHLSEVKLETAAGTTHWQVNKSAYRNTAHEIIGVIGISRDITSIRKAEEERKKLEDQLQQAQKIESIGQLAGGVAHDFNNMLGVILGHAEMAIEQLDPSQPLFADLQEIRKAAERSADITRQLLAFARRQTAAPRVLDLNETVEGMLKMMRRLIGEDVDLAWLPGSGLWTVKVDPSQIDQILANLCINARHAISGVGKITVETGNRTLGEKDCAAHPDLLPGEYVRIAVHDNGCGMDRETQARIFEPFFTTKRLGEGTGLGLATVYGIVRQNGGVISVSSEPGKGTTFTIYLPRHRGEDEQAGVAGETPPAEGGREIILLVEDEPMLLKMAASMLQRLGYSVLTAGAPGEAIRLAEGFAGTIHLLVTDVIMPEMNGRTLAEKLLESRPAMKCLFMSGYTDNLIPDQDVVDRKVSFIPKPFANTELAARVRELLEGQ